MTDFSSRAGLSGISGFKPNVVTVVDLSKEPERPNIVREGFLVPPVAVRPEIIDQVGVVKPVDPLRVVVQSIPAGTRVPKGTVVDIKVIDPRDLDLDIIIGVHRGLAERKIGTVIEQFLEDDGLRQSVLAADKPTDLSDVGRQQILRAAERNDVAVDEGDPQNNFDALFTSLRGAAAFR